MSMEPIRCVGSRAEYPNINVAVFTLVLHLFIFMTGSTILHHGEMFTPCSMSSLNPFMTILTGEGCLFQVKLMRKIEIPLY
jgi:hypothetical protein